MTRTIGIFEREDQVLGAIERLRSAGLRKDQLRVIVDNEENAPLLSSQAEVPMEGAAGLRETMERAEREGGGWDEAAPIVPAAAWYGTSPSSGPTGGAAPFAAFAFAAWGGDEGTDRLTAEMGVPSHLADECAAALGEGKLLLMADAGGSGDEERTLQAAGALRVLR